MGTSGSICERPSYSHPQMTGVSNYMWIFMLVCVICVQETLQHEDNLLQNHTSTLIVTIGPFSLVSYETFCINANVIFCRQPALLACAVLSIFSAADRNPRLVLFFLGQKASTTISTLKTSSMQELGNCDHGHLLHVKSYHVALPVPDPFLNVNLPTTLLRLCMVSNLPKSK